MYDAIKAPEKSIQRNKVIWESGINKQLNISKPLNSYVVEGLQFDKILLQATPSVKIFVYRIVFTELH